MGLENLKRRSLLGWIGGLVGASAVTSAVADAKPVVEAVEVPVVALSPEPVKPPLVVDQPAIRRSHWITASAVAACAHNALTSGRGGYKVEYLDEYVPEENIRYASADIDLHDEEIPMGLRGKPDFPQLPSTPKGLEKIAYFVRDQLKAHGFYDLKDVEALAENVFGCPAGDTWELEDLWVAEAYGRNLTFMTVEDRIRKAVADIESQLSAVSHQDIVCPKTHPPNNVEWSEQVHDAYITVRVLRSYDIRGNMKITKIQVPYAYRRDTGERAWAESDRRRKEEHEAKLAAIRDRSYTKADLIKDTKTYDHFAKIRDNLVEQFGRERFASEPGWQHLDKFVNDLAKKNARWS